MERNEGSITHTGIGPEAFHLLVTPLHPDDVAAFNDPTWDDFWDRVAAPPEPQRTMRNNTAVILMIARCRRSYNQNRHQRQALAKALRTLTKKQRWAFYEKLFVGAMNDDKLNGPIIAHQRELSSRYAITL